MEERILLQIERRTYQLYFSGLALAVLTHPGLLIFLPAQIRIFSTLVFSLGLLLILLGVLGAAGFRRLHEFQSYGKDPYSQERLSAQFRRDALIRLAHAALYLAAASILIAAVFYFSKPQRESRSTTLELSSAADARMQALIDVLARNGPGSSVQLGATSLQVDPVLREAVLKYLAQQTTSKGSSSPSLWLIILIVAGAAAMVIFALRKRPDGAATIGVTALAGTALKYADHVSRVDPKTYVEVVIALSILSGLIAVVCGIQAWRAAKPTQEHATGGEQEQKTGQELEGKGFWDAFRTWLFHRKSEGKEPESPLVIALLAFLLLFTFCIVAYEPKKEVDASTSSPKVAVAVESLGTRFLFEKGSPLRELQAPALRQNSNPGGPRFDSQLETVRREIAAFRPHPGDQIILVGMADCTSFSGGNSKLAMARTDHISGLLSSYAKNLGVNIVQLPLPQSEICKPYDQQRAVVPYFARIALQTEPSSSP